MKHCFRFSYCFYCNFNPLSPARILIRCTTRDWNPPLPCKRGRSFRQFLSPATSMTPQHLWNVTAWYFDEKVYPPVHFFVEKVYPFDEKVYNPLGPGTKWGLMRVHFFVEKVYGGYTFSSKKCTPFSKMLISLGPRTKWRVHFFTKKCTPRTLFHVEKVYPRTLFHVEKVYPPYTFSRKHVLYEVLYEFPYGFTKDILKDSLKDFLKGFP